MECRSEIHQLPNNMQRMDLHCFNQKCRLENRINQYFGVIVNSPNPWICLKYGLVYSSEGKEYILTGERSDQCAIFGAILGSTVFGLKTKIITGYSDQYPLISVPF